jgi:hypothetical protein
MPQMFELPHNQKSVGLTEDLKIELMSFLKDSPKLTTANETAGLRWAPEML